MRKILICILLNCIFCSCPEEPGLEMTYENEVIWVINHCNEKVYVYDYISDYNAFVHPLHIEYWQHVEPSDSICLRLKDSPTVDDSYYMVQVLILKQSTLDTYSFDEIEKNAIVDQRYILIKDRIIKDGGVRIVYNDENIETHE